MDSMPLSWNNVATGRTCYRLLLSYYCCCLISDCWSCLRAWTVCHWAETMLLLAEPVTDCYLVITAAGSFHIRSTNFWPFLRWPPPICFKFGTFVDIYYTNQNANFQLCKSSGFRDMTLTNMGKRSFFAPTQHIKTIITLVLLGVESWLIALFKALMQL